MAAGFMITPTAPSLGAITEAFAEASAGTGSPEDIRRALERRAGEIDLAAALVALRYLVGLVSIETGETPRSVLEEEFTRAPADQFWRETTGAAL